MSSVVEQLVHVAEGSDDANLSNHCMDKLEALLDGVVNADKTTAVIRQQQVGDTGEHLFTQFAATLDDMRRSFQHPCEDETLEEWEC